MLVGLQGSGKTTTAAKIAKRLTERQKQKVLMASLDTRRPAAQEQLRVLGEQAGIDTLPIVGQMPVEIATRAVTAARLGGYDVVILDTAGRTHIDEPLMAEMAEIKDATNPHEILLVADALTGQDAVNLAKSFNERVGITGIVPHPRRRRRPRRRGALHARRHRQADQADRRRREARCAGGFRSGAHRRPHPRHGRHRRPGREGGGRPSTPSKAAEGRRAHAQGRLRPRRPRRAARADAEDRRHVGRDGHAARHRQGEEADRRHGHRRFGLQAAGGDHLVDDRGPRRRTPTSSRRPQEARRRRLRHARSRRSTSSSRCTARWPT